MFMEIINDIGQGVTGANAATNVLTMCSGRKAAGAQACIVYTMYSPFGFTTAQSAQLTIANNTLRAACGQGTIDAIVPLDTAPQFQNTAPGSGYIADGVHPNDAGHALIYSMSYQALEAVYQRTGSAPF